MGTMKLPMRHIKMISKSAEVMMMKTNPADERSDASLTSTYPL
jgi:hypothetical protein